VPEAIKEKVSVREDLGELRAKIDNIDEKIIMLLSERFAVTEEVGEFKKQHEMDAVSNEREEYQFKRIVSLAQQYHVPDSLAKDILRRIIDEVVKNHKRIKAEDT
jgi:chorismate mutase